MTEITNQDMNLDNLTEEQKQMSVQILDEKTLQDVVPVEAQPHAI